MAVPSHQILLDLATSPSSPYREKDAAQAAGARWGRTTKSWFYTADMDSPGFDQWKVREPEAGRRAPFALVAPFNQIFDVAGTRGGDRHLRRTFLHQRHVSPEWCAVMRFVSG